MRIDYISMRRSPEDIRTLKNPACPLVCLTAYTAPFATAIDRHCDILLVGDSVAMTIYGMASTRGATMDMMAAHGRAVTNATTQACIVIDMPFGSYEDSDEDALRNARRLMTETGAQAVKLEGGLTMATRIRTLVDAGIPVLGHVGLLPQQFERAEDFKIQGRDAEGARKILEDAKAAEEAGVFALVIEGVPEPVAAEITQNTSVPTIGIGASGACDGQILVCDDVLGLNTGHVAKFVKTYADLAGEIDRAAAAYAADVRARRFPTPRHVYGTIKTKD